VAAGQLSRRGPSSVGTRGQAAPDSLDDAPRRRRAPGEIQRLILDAARQSFTERGYARSTTRDIAARADVAETLLFRNFGSKANLFGESALAPMADFLARWVDFTDPDTDDQAEVLQRRFTEALYQRAVENRGLLLTFFATSVFEPEVLEGHEATQRIQQAIDDLAKGCEERLVRLGVDTSELNVGISARATIAMILGVALFEDWLMPRGRRPSRAQVVDEMTRQILFGGFNERPAGFRPAPPSARRRTGTARTTRTKVAKRA
jgi:AcrR family transcriptional regulator